MKKAILLGAILVAPHLCIADENPLFNDMGISAKAGLAGLGFDVTKSFGNSFKVRFGYSDFKYSANYNKNNTNFHGDLRLSAFNLVGDWHPLDNGFRATFGGYSPRHKFSADARPNNGGTITINHQSFSNVSADMSVKWSKDIRPYLGIGYDSFPASKKGSLFFTVDVGVIFAGTPSVRLRAHCDGAPECNSATLDAAVAAEEAKIRDDLKGAKYLPVVQMGIGYRF